MGYSMSYNLSDLLKIRLRDLWDRDINHPFVLELYSGTLPLNKFKYYLLQDYNYLVMMTKTLSILAAKAPTLELTKLALELAYGTVTGEMDNYRKLLSMLNLAIDDAIKVRPNPVNTAYMNYLLATAYQGDFYVGLTATLPCFWTYLDIAEAHKDKLANNRVEVYKVWASTYLSNQYRDLVNLIKRIIDNSGKNLEELQPYFELALKYEIMFWDASYRMEEWAFLI